MIKLPAIVREFLLALTKPYTYNLKENHYAIFGILWGIPIPIVTIGIGLYFSGAGLDWHNIIAHIANYPLYIFFILHPVLFGVVFGAMGTVRDEKEKERLSFENSLLAMNTELKRVNAKLKELDELKDSFLSMVSHELLSPLTTIQGYISFLRQEKSGSLSERQASALKIAEEEAERLKYLIEQLMDLSKIEAGKFEVKLSSVDINNIMARVKDKLKPLLEEGSLSLENKFPVNLPLVLADPERITQVFSNLLGNAIKFTPAGGRIAVYANTRDDRVVCCIEDSGIGIPKENLDKVFDKFYQIDSRLWRRYGGCGLGLSISKSIIELHQGHIWVESQEGKGSKFCFELKACRQ